jgi:hypothetical protein
MNPVRTKTYIHNDKGDVCYHDSLGDFLLENDDVVEITWLDGTKENITISVFETEAEEIKECGGGFHGFIHMDSSRVAYFYKDGNREFLKFIDALDIKVVKCSGLKFSDFVGNSH